MCFLSVLLYHRSCFQPPVRNLHPAMLRSTNFKVCCNVPYCRFILRETIFMNFADLLLSVKILFANITIKASA